MAWLRGRDADFSKSTLTKALKILTVPQTFGYKEKRANPSMTPNV